MAKAQEDGPFYCLGHFPVFEARKILPRLEEANIRYEIDTDHSGLTGLAPAVAEYGAYGNGSTIQLFIHRDDEKKFKKISGEFFKL